MTGVPVSRRPGAIIQAKGISAPYWPFAPSGLPVEGQTKPALLQLREEPAGQGS